MRLLAAGFVVAALVLVVCFAVMAWRVVASARVRDVKSARWAVAHSGAGGVTVVRVVLSTVSGEVLESRRSVSIPDGTAGYEASMHGALEDARELATALNLEDGRPV